MQYKKRTMYEEMESFQLGNPKHVISDALRLTTGGERQEAIRSAMGHRSCFRDVPQSCNWWDAGPGVLLLW